MNLISRGLAETFAVFLIPLEAEFKVERVALTGIYSTYMLVYGLAAPAAGYLIDRVGVRVCYALGLSLFAMGYLLASQATALWQLYILIGALCGAGSVALGMVPASLLASRWFDRRLPSAMSALYAALGIGVLIFAPVSQALIESTGWRGTYLRLGLLPLALLPLLIVLPWSRMTHGDPSLADARRRAASRRTSASERQGIRAELSAALATSGFWKLAGVMFFTTLATYLTLIQLVAYLIARGFDPLVSASVYGLVGILSTVGMIVSGLFAERFGERAVATVAYSCTIAGVACLSLVSIWPGYLLVGAFALLFGSVSGSRGPLIAVLSSRLFPGRAQSTIYGTVLLAMGIGGAIAGWSGGALHDATGGYQAGLALSAIAALFGMILFRSIDTGQRPTRVAP